MKTFNIHAGDSLAVLKTYPDNHFDSVVTDPPYGLGKEPDAIKMLADWVECGVHTPKSKRGFMGKEWDAFVPQPILWAEVYRVLKPGGHVLAFAGTRTQDLMCLGLRLAGFEIRDLVAWAYGSGFPKSHDVSKAIDKAAGADRTVVGSKITGKARTDGVWQGGQQEVSITAPATPAAQEWSGWGTALKPALEPITLARKPLEGTVAENVLKWRTGAINIDGCKVGSERVSTHSNGAGQTGDGGIYGAFANQKGGEERTGRHPANLIHDGSDEVLELFPGDDRKTAARFFYCAKAQKKDREEGLEEFEPASTGVKGNGLARVCEHCGAPQLSPEKCTCPEKSWVNPERANSHPTVKPTALMAYLCRLITPPGGLILDPFMGSGSTGKAAVQEGFRFVGIDLSEEFCAIAQARIENELSKKEKTILSLFGSEEGTQ